MSGEHGHPEYGVLTEQQALRGDLNSLWAEHTALAARVAALEAGQPEPPPPEPADVFLADLVDGSNVKVTTNDSWWADWSQVPRGVDPTWGSWIQPEVDRSLTQGSGPRYRAEIDLPDGVVPYHASGSRWHDMTDDTYWSGVMVQLGVPGDPWIDDGDQYADSIHQLHTGAGNPPVYLSAGPDADWRLRVDGTNYFVAPWQSGVWVKVVLAVRFGDRVRLWLDDVLVHDGAAPADPGQVYWKLGIYKSGNRQSWVANNAMKRVARFTQWRLAKGADRYVDVAPRA